MDVRIYLDAQKVKPYHRIAVISTIVILKIFRINQIDLIYYLSVFLFLFLFYFAFFSETLLK